MEDVTIGLIFGFAMCFVLCNGFWMVFTSILLFWKKVRGARVELIDIVQDHNSLWVRAKYSIWQSKNKFIYESGKADVKEVYKSSWFIGKSDPVELNNGDYIVVPGKLIKQTVIIKGIKTLKEWATSRIAELQYKMSIIEAEKMSLIYEIERLQNNFDITVDKKIKFMIDEMVQVAPYMTKGQKKS
jgi:hypothetical protein